MIFKQKPLHPLPPFSPFLMDSIRLHGMPTTSFEEVLQWNVIRYSYQFFYFLFYISSYISRYHFYNLQEFLELSEKNFCPKFSFFNRFTLSSQPFFFPKIYWQNLAKHFLLKVPTTDSLVFFSKHSSTKTILTQASVITCK